jgi:hypothetical protein
MSAYVVESRTSSASRLSLQRSRGFHDGRRNVYRPPHKRNSLCKLLFRYRDSEAAENAAYDAAWTEGHKAFSDDPEVCES